MRLLQGFQVPHVELPVENQNISRKEVKNMAQTKGPEKVIYTGEDPQLRGYTYFEKTEYDIFGVYIDSDAEVRRYRIDGQRYNEVYLHHQSLAGTLEVRQLIRALEICQPSAKVRPGFSRTNGKPVLLILDDPEHPEAVNEIRFEEP